MLGQVAEIVPSCCTCFLSNRKRKQQSIPVRIVANGSVIGSDDECPSKNLIGVQVVYDNPLDNVEDLAHIFFQRCLEAVSANGKCSVSS